MMKCATSLSLSQFGDNSFPNSSSACIIVVFLILIKAFPISGGQKSRVAFAKITFKKPHIILLDEPSNHLVSKSPYPFSSLCRRGSFDSVSTRKDEIPPGTRCDWLCEPVFVAGS